MTAEDLKKRQTIMKRSIALGHCVCDPKKPCPCPIFKEQNVCECAGEKLPIKSDGQIRLTEYVRGAGCASKIGKKDLKDVLKGLPVISDSRVDVGSSAGDDAGVITLSEEEDKSLIFTVDVFAPSVDDPYTFGQIAAANSLSDIYAMGGIPVSALSVIGFPIHTLPNSVMHEILRGGIDKMSEAGISVIGGHSINDEEIKCGFAVIGTCDKGAHVRNSGAKKGDIIVLTKPIGVGIAAFAAQIKRASESLVNEISESMTSLNKNAAALMIKYGATSGTDVTGYSLIGHVAEIVKNSAIEIEINFDSIPLFSDIKDLARQEVLPGAVERNRESVDPELLDFSQLTDAQQSILFCPETSGGILAFIPKENVDQYILDLKSVGNKTVAIIGEVTGDLSNGLIKVTTSCADQYGNMQVEKLEKENPTMLNANESQCCCSDESQATSSCCSDESQATSCCSDTTQATSSCCASSQEVESVSSINTIKPSVIDVFQSYMAEVNKPGSINLKNKKLIALALSIITKCEPCVKINTKACLDAGAIENEIAEAASMAIAFGGAPIAMFYNSLRETK